MFTVRGELRSQTDSIARTLFSATRVSVRPYQRPQEVGFSGRVAEESQATEPRFEIDLFGSDHMVETLTVGPGLDHYETVYIMNAQGQTVDTVRS